MKQNKKRLGFMLDNSSSPSTFYVPVAPRISSILCPSESNIEGKLVQDYAHILINSHKLSETRDEFNNARARRALFDWYLSLFVMCKA